MLASLAKSRRFSGGSTSSTFSITSSSMEAKTAFTSSPTVERFISSILARQNGKFLSSGGETTARLFLRRVSRLRLRSAVVKKCLGTMHNTATFPKGNGCSGKPENILRPTQEQPAGSKGGWWCFPNRSGQKGISWNDITRHDASRAPQMTAGRHLIEWRMVFQPAFPRQKPRNPACSVQGNSVTFREANVLLYVLLWPVSASKSAKNIDFIALFKMVAGGGIG
jgi:hypothetical protein